jgi:membrane associated rhomboid family serine protease
MRVYPGNPNHEPYGHVGRVPVYAATIIAVLMCAGMFATTMLETVGGPLQLFVFSTGNFYLHGWIWQLLTCTFINEPNFFFLFGIYFFYRFGVEFEQYLGHRAFLTLYALLLVALAVVLGLWQFAGIPGEFSGMSDITIGVFIAYATLYPNLEYFGWVPLKHIAFACIAISALSYFPTHDWPGLSVMLAICGVSFGYTRYKKLGGAMELPAFAHRLNPFHRRPKFRVLPSPEGSSPRLPSGGSGSVQSVDAILDKIAQQGFASLTQDERDQLEKAREILNKKRS